MNERSASRTRYIKLVLSATCLSLVIAIFTIPPNALASLDAPPAELLVGLGIWVVPALLGVVTLYSIASTTRDSTAYILGILGVITLLTFLLNLRTISTSPGTFTYGGEGAFFGPLLTLLTGSLIALVVVGTELATAIIDRTRTEAS